MNKFPNSGAFAWLGSGAIQLDQILFYFNRGDSPCNDKNKEIVRKTGSGWVNAEHLEVFLETPQKDYYEIIKNALKFFPFSFRDTDIWLWTISIRADLQTRCFKNLLQSYNIKGVHQHEEISSYTGAFLIGAKMGRFQ